MTSYELGAVIAERQLELVKADGDVVPCSVKVGQPIPDDHDDWVCPYQLEASDSVQLFGMHGIDSMQALVLTLKTLDGEISSAAKKFGATVRFLDGDHESIFKP